ncbi:hypothetical protein Dimus_036072 [Dionaea muscipula]
MCDSSPDLEAFSSSEDGVGSNFVVSSEEAAECSELEDGLMDSTTSPMLSPIPEERGKMEASISSISGSSTLSPLTAVLRCKDAIDAGGVLEVSTLAFSGLGVVNGGHVVEDGGTDLVVGMSLIAEPDDLEEVAVTVQSFIFFHPFP